MIKKRCITYAYIYIYNHYHIYIYIYIYIYTSVYPPQDCERQTQHKQARTSMGLCAAS